MAPRAYKRDTYALAPRTLVVDNGAYTLKAGFVTRFPNADSDCSVIPNCLAKGVQNQTWVGAQLNECMIVTLIELVIKY